MAVVNDNTGTSYAVTAPATINVKVAPYSAVGDGQRVLDGAITINTATLVCATSAPFTPSDVGKTIFVSGASSGTPSTLHTTIAAFVSSTTVTLTANATATISSSTVRWGTDDSSAVQAAFTAAKVTGGKVFFPRGRYFVSTIDISQFNTLTKQLIVEGEGRDATIIQHTGSNVCVYLGGSMWTTWRDLSLDSSSNSQVGFLLCRTSTPTSGAGCDNHKFVNVGTTIGSIWSKAALVGIDAEQVELDRCYFDNGGSAFGTIWFTQKNDTIGVTAPNSDVISTVYLTALGNRITNSSIYCANGGAACVTVEYGAGLVIDGHTMLSAIGAVTTAVGLRIAGDATSPSIAPVVISGALIEMFNTAAGAIELKSYSGTNTITAPVIRDTFITQSTKVFAYSGAVTVNGFVYEGNAELQTADLTMTGTWNFPRITMTSVNTSVVLSSGASINGGFIAARTITDSGATITATTQQTLNAITSGGWTLVTFAAGNFTTDTGTWTVGSGDQLSYAYRIEGKTMTVIFTLNATTVATNPTQLRIAIPASKVATRRVDTVVSVNDSGAGEVAAVATILASGTYISVSKFGGAAFAASTDNTLVRGEVIFEIN